MPSNDKRADFAIAVSVFNLQPLLEFKDKDYVHSSP